MLGPVGEEGFEQAQDVVWNLPIAYSYRFGVSRLGFCEPAKVKLFRVRRQIAARVSLPAQKTGGELQDDMSSTCSSNIDSHPFLQRASNGVQP